MRPKIREKKKPRKKLHTDRAKKDEWEIDPGSDYPVHEKYTGEEPVKE